MFDLSLCTRDQEESGMKTNLPARRTTALAVRPVAQVEQPSRQHPAPLAALSARSTIAVTSAVAAISVTAAGFVHYLVQ
jgi:hypothetical protein